MYNERKRWFPFFILIMIAGFFLLSWIVMLLWNYIMPALLNTAFITYWQSVGLLLLSKIVFGGFRRRPGGFRSYEGNKCGPPWRRKWMQMSDEEKAKFKEEWRRRKASPNSSEGGN